MSNPWFRMYHEFATDPKIQMLSEVNQRRYLMVLCLRCSNADVTLQDEQVAFQLRIAVDEWLQSKAVLQAANLICNDNKPTAWDKRQYLSDSSTARVARHRAKQEKPKKQPCNVTVTPPDTDTDTENTYSSFEDFWTAYPRKTNRKTANTAWMKLKPKQETLDLITQNIDDRLAAGDWRLEEKNYIPHATTYLNQRRWEDEVIPTGNPLKVAGGHGI